MTTTTQPIDLDAIRARVTEATSGPWVAADDGLVWGPAMGDPAAGCADPANAEFVTHARQDIPDLLAEVERLRTERDWLLAEADDDTRTRYFRVKHAEAATR